MNRYGQYCPTARAVEVLGDRWTLLIVRDLLCGAHHFNDLERGLPGISRSLLAGRLRHLQRAGILERKVTPGDQRICYQLTRAGMELKEIVDALTNWGAKWAFGESEPAELDPVLLLWLMRNRVYFERLPKRQIVVEFQFRPPHKGNYWLVLKPGDVSVCLQHPGFDSDVNVKADLSTLYQVWYGHISFAEALRDQRVELDGIPALIREFPRWFALSHAAQAVRKAAKTSQ